MSRHQRIRQALVDLTDKTGWDFYRSTQFLLLAAIYSVGLGVAFFTAYEMRFDFALTVGQKHERLQYFVWFLGLKLLFLFLFGQFRAWVSYFGVPDFVRIVLALSASSWVTFLVWWTSDGRMAPSRGVILIDLLLAIAALASIRLGLRVMRERLARRQEVMRKHAFRTLVVGAGDVGAAVVYDFIRRPALGLKPVAFLDDNSRKHGLRIHGVRVVGSVSALPAVVRKYRIEKIILTMPSATPKKIKEITELGRSVGLAIETVPSTDQLASGEVRIDRIRPVDVEDLLGREPVSLDSSGIAALIRNQVVMVTGAGGSIGAELCRQIAAQNPDRLLLVEQCEVQLFLVEQELISLGYGGCIVPVIADILDGERMTEVFDLHRPEIIFHAAAHKHVPMMERQPGEAIKNNSFGTAHLCFQASRFRVKKFVLISTDKAINPTNVMGASKRLAELALQARHYSPGNKTQFMAVRFGNVLGSSGSVIPTFKKQIAAGGPVTVTHRDVTRYFMTIPEAVGLVLQAATMGKGGEIFVLDMGHPVKIIDIARQLIELSGFRPEVDIEIKVTGLRPGEKLYEELQHNNEQFAPTGHPRVMRFTGPTPTLEHMVRCFDELEEGLGKLEPKALKTLIRKFVPEYVPYFD